MPKPDMSQRAALYRLFDAKGRLLYVGISLDPAARWKQHRGDKQWWPEVIDKQVIWYDTRILALQAEAMAIRDELPIHNGIRPHLITGIPLALGGPAEPDPFDLELQAAAEERARTKRVLDEANRELRVLVARGRAAGKGPSHMARLTGFTREWVSKIAPEPKAG
jgi:predicted GIY-YIG superfamily endonuclease